MDDKITDKLIGARAQQLVASLNGSGSLTSQSATDPEIALARAQLLAGCYRKDDAADPETYATALAAVLALYSPDIVQQVTDPRTGLPSRVQWLPTIKEVRDECDAIDGHRRRLAAAAAREEQQLRDRREFEASKQAKPTYDYLKARYGDNWGLKQAKEEAEAKVKRTAAMQEVNRLSFEAECKSAGFPSDSPISPSLAKLLGRKPEAAA
jgi:hypothetical protein